MTGTFTIEEDYKGNQKVVVDGDDERTMFEIRLTQDGELCIHTFGVVKFNGVMLDSGLKTHAETRNELYVSRMKYFDE